MPTKIDANKIYLTHSVTHRDKKPNYNNNYFKNWRYNSQEIYE